MSEDLLPLITGIAGILLIFKGIIGLEKTNNLKNKTQDLKNQKLEEEINLLKEKQKLIDNRTIFGDR